MFSFGARKPLAVFERSAQNEDGVIMKNRAGILAVIVTATLFFVACSKSEDSSKFANEAAQGGMAEVEMGRLAVARANNAEVQQFGQRMIDDHSKGNNELMQLAERKKIQLPKNLASEEREMVDKLSKRSAADFDKAYVDAMVEDHEHDVKAFEEQAEGGTDPDLKQWAAKTLPTLKQHLEMIRAIKSKMK
jgi:putative membrane protein